jgi:hypothetical protein
MWLFVVVSHLSTDYDQFVCERLYYLLLRDDPHFTLLMQMYSHKLSIYIFAGSTFALGRAWSLDAAHHRSAVFRLIAIQRCRRSCRTIKATVITRPIRVHAHKLIYVEEIYLKLTTVAARSDAWNVFVRSNSGVEDPYFQNICDGKTGQRVEGRRRYVWRTNKNYFQLVFVGVSFRLFSGSFGILFLAPHRTLQSMDLLKCLPLFCPLDSLANLCGLFVAFVLI